MILIENPLFSFKVGNLHHMPYLNQHGQLNMIADDGYAINMLKQKAARDVYLLNPIENLAGSKLKYCSLCFKAICI